MREVFISVLSFVLEANVNASTMRFGSNNDGRHDIKVFILAVMDGEGERSIFISHESGYCCSPQRCFRRHSLVSLVVVVRQRC